ncbi:MAG TPA: hypothetical protein VFH27_15480 [Longimicrobiaceae bacterium]|nr:hypothetical protein [Longimicrobiaceae bacterium]
MVPSERERERGLQPIDLDAPRRSAWRGVGIGLGAVALLGAGVAVAIQTHRRRRRSWMGRLHRAVGWIS